MTETRHILLGGNDNPNVDLTEIFKPLEEIEELPWELQNDQPFEEEPLPLALTALAIALPSALLLALTTLL